MSNDTEVKVQNVKGTIPWFKKSFYRKDGSKDTLNFKKMGWGFFAVFVITVIFSLMQGAPEVAPSPSQISPPGSIAENTGTIDVPQTRIGEAPVVVSPGKKGAAGGRSKARFLGPQLVNRPRMAVPPGMLVKARLLTGASNGPVKAEITESLTVNGETVIEKGAVLLGTGASNEDRLQVRFNQMVFKDGAFQSVQGQAYDPEDKIVGLKGSKVGSKALNIAGSIGLGFLGGMSEGLQDTQGQQGVAVRPPTIKNALLNATATTALEQSQNMMSNLKNSQPVIEVPESSTLLVGFEAQ
jgi:hypothetical protein